MIIAEGKETALYNSDRSERRMQTTVRPIWILAIHYSIIVWNDDCLEILLLFFLQGPRKWWIPSVTNLVRKKIGVLACAVHTAPLNNTRTNISSPARRYS